MINGNNSRDDLRKKRPRSAAAAFVLRWNLLTPSGSLPYHATKLASKCPSHPSNPPQQPTPPPTIERFAVLCPPSSASFSALSSCALCSRVTTTVISAESTRAVPTRQTLQPTAPPHASIHENLVGSSRGSVCNCSRSRGATAHLSSSFSIASSVFFASLSSSSPSPSSPGSRRRLLSSLSCQQQPRRLRRFPTSHSARVLRHHTAPRHRTALARGNNTLAYDHHHTCIRPPEGTCTNDQSTTPA